MEGIIANQDTITENNQNTDKLIIYGSYATHVPLVAEYYDVENTQPVTLFLHLAVFLTSNDYLDQIVIHIAKNFTS